METIRLKDALYNTAKVSGSSIDYGKGVVVGVVSTLMAYNIPFEAAYDIMCESLPKDFRTACIPVGWRKLK
jgi:hypothetical protein